MSEKVDRRIGSSSLLPVVLIVILVLIVGAGVVVWLRMESAPVAVQSGRMPVRTARPDEPLLVTLFLPSGGTLSQKLMPVKRQPDAQAQAREVLNAELPGGTAGSPVLKELRLRGFFLDPDGTGYVDLNALPQGGLNSPAGDELLAIYAIVNTLIQNFEEIKRIRFLIDGREAQTLSGHVDLSRTFTLRPDLAQQ